jgi:hypothetical protein
MLLDIRSLTPTPLQSREGLMAGRPCAFSPDEAWLVCNARPQEHDPLAGKRLETIAFDLRTNDAGTLISADGGEVQAKRISWLAPGWLVLYGGIVGEAVWSESPETGVATVLHAKVRDQTTGFFAATAISSAAAYAGDCGGKLGLCVERFDRSGLVSTEVLRTGKLRVLNWSPNGQHLLVVEGDKPHLLRNVFGPHRSFDPLGPVAPRAEITGQFSPGSEWVIVRRGYANMGDQAPQHSFVMWHIPSLAHYDLSTGQYAMGWVSFTDDDRMMAGVIAGSDGRRLVLVVRRLAGATVEQPVVVAEAAPNHLDYAWQPRALTTNP